MGFYLVRLKMMNFNFPIILASKSPRRQQLLRDAGFTFSVLAPQVDESYPDDLPKRKIPEFLAEKKALSIQTPHKESIILAADTIVLLEDKVMGKPSDKKEAKGMLECLSNRSHEVISGVCIIKNNQKKLLIDTTKVYFKKLDTMEIEYYIDKFQPFDKAGAYGIQEWIGMIGVKKIEGSFYNVVGLPIENVYQALSEF